MRVRVDQKADAVYLNLTDRAVSESEEVDDGIVVDYDTDGRVVGIEIIDASKRTGNPEALKDFSSICRERRSTITIKFEHDDAENAWRGGVHKTRTKILAF